MILACGMPWCPGAGVELALLTGIPAFFGTVLVFIRCILRRKKAPKCECSECKEGLWR